MIFTAFGPSGFFRDFSSVGIFIPRIGIFFMGWDIPTKSNLWLLIMLSDMIIMFKKSGTKK